MKAKLLIAFGHKRLRGKDTAGAIAQDHLKILGHSTRKDSFADPLKRACINIFGFSDEQIYGSLKEVTDEFWGFSPRWALQTMGTEAVRNTIGRDVWVKSLERRFLANPEHIIITDLRFPNEAEGIQRMGGVLVRVDRDRPFEPSKDGHISETALDNWTKWDYVIDNNGTLAELEQTTKSIVLSELQKRQLLKGCDGCPEK
jgi:hypothetical protein